MGHANLSNISRIVNRLLKQDMVTIREMVNELDRKKIPLQASEGEYRDRFMLSHGVELIIDHFYKQQLVEPVAVTRKQQKILREWREGDTLSWDCGDDGEGGEYAILDSIRWHATRKRLPVMGYITE